VAGYITKSFLISLVAGIGTWMFTSLWSGPVLIWASFIAWACFFQSKVKNKALLRTITGSIFGAVCGWFALLIMQSIPWPAAPGMPSWWALVFWEDTNQPWLTDVNLTSLWAGGAVLITVLVMSLFSKIETLGVLPAGACGYSCVIAAGMADPSYKAWKSLLSISMENTLFAVIASMTIGAVIGFLFRKYKT
tara:strand:- start:868 stop:1443 length:576 start_codon:yes stop_codon:yes gene_type:complete